MKTFDKNNIDHLRCVRDVEMEMRYGDKCCIFNDAHNDIRQYVRNVLVNKTETNEDVIQWYNKVKELLQTV